MAVKIVDRPAVPPPPLTPLTPAVDAPVPSFQPGPPEAYRRSTLGIIMNIVLGLDLFIVALGIIVGILIGLAIISSPDSQLAQNQREGYVEGITSWSTILTNFAFLGAVPFLWVVATRRETWVGTKRYLALHRPLRSGLIGVGLAGWFLGPVILIFFLVPHGTPTSQEAATATRFAATPVLLLVATGLMAGIGEEILFRGVLYRWVGWWPQAFLFTAAHFANGEPVQLVIALVVGLVFGWLRRLGWSLVALMAAHATYDTTLLLLAKFST